MQICKRILLLVTFLSAFSAVLSHAAENAIQDFMRERGASEKIVSKWMQQHGRVNECTKSGNYLLCINARTLRSKNTDNRVIQAELNILSLKARHRLYSEIAKRSDHSRYSQKNTVEELCLSGAEKKDNRFVLKNVEFQSACIGSWCAAVASVPYYSSIKKISETYNSKKFSDEYSDALYPQALKLFNDKKYIESLVLLKEIHDLKRARADAYILAAQAFFLTEQRRDALKIAREVFHELKSQLTVELGEQLGDLFFELGQQNEAIEAYNYAASRLNITY